MAVTIKSSAQAWASDGSSRAWTARVLWDTGSALYAFVQDSGASPKVRALKANSRLSPTSFSEQDSGNNKSGTQNLSYDSYWDGSVFQVITHSATNTVTHYTFDPSTDTWGAGNGNASTAMVGYRSVRIVKVPGNGELVVAGSDSTDNSDLRYARYASGSWTTALFLSVTSTPSSRVVDIQASGNFAHIFYYDMANLDFSDRSLSGATLGTETDMDTSAASSTESSHACGGRFNPWTSGGNPVASTVFGNIGSTLMGTRDVRLDLTSATQTSFSGPAYASSSYGGASSWWDSATSTLWVVRGDSSTNTSGSSLMSNRVSGTWGGSATTLVSSVLPIELAPIGVGCAHVYQDGSNNVIMDQLVAYAAVGDTGTISTGNLSVSGQTIGADVHTLASITTQNLVVSGQSIAGRGGVLAVLSTGQPSLQGQSIAGRSGVLASLSTQNLVVSGQTILVDVHLLASITTQNLSVSGQTIIATAAGSIVGAINTGNHVVSGQSIGATFGVLAVLSTGTPSLQGQSITGKWGDLGAISTQNLVVSGQSIAARTGVLGSITTGTPALQGQSIAASSGVLAVLVTGTPSLQGQSISGRWGTLGTLSTQNLVVSGQTILASASLSGIISTQNLSVSGQSIAARWGTLATLSTGTPSLQGQTILGNLGVLATVNNGPLSVSGQSINAGTSFIGSINTGNLSVSGQSIVAIYGVVAVLDTGILVVSGNPIIADIGAFYEVDEAYIVNVFVRPTVLHTINKYNSTVVGARQREIKVGHE